MFKNLEKKETTAEDVLGDPVLVQHETIIETGFGKDEVSGGINFQTQEGSRDSEIRIRARIKTKWILPLII